MVENPDFHLLYERMNPYQRNQELKGLFDMLPDFGAIWPIRNVTGKGLSENLDFEQFLDFSKTYKERETHRLSSQTRGNLVSRLNALLPFGFTTDHCKAYIAREYEDFSKVGIGKSSLFGFTPQLEQWGEDLRWTHPEHGGMFVKDEAQVVDTSLYNRAVRSLVRSKAEQQRYEQASGLDFDSRKRIEEALDAYREKREISEELGKLGVDEAMAVSLAKNAKTRVDAERLILDGWRVAHIQGFGDEP